MINITNNNKIWKIKIEETLGFENFEEMEKVLNFLLLFKKENGNVTQLMEQVKNDTK